LNIACSETAWLLSWIKPVGFESGSKPVRNEFGQDIRLYQVRSEKG